jgi:hypothetical protein
MHLPDIFAIYRPESETFQILQPDTASDGSYLRLKNWSVPDNNEWKTASSEERAKMLAWFRGQEWYVVPTNKYATDEEPRIHTITLHGKTYHWWSTHHKLVWSNMFTFRSRNGGTAESWANCPSVLVIELSSRLIIPRTDTSMHAKWYEASIPNLITEKERGSVAYNALTLEEDRDDTGSLRIRTPPAASFPEDSSDTDTEELIQYAPRRGQEQRRRFTGVFSEAFMNCTLFVVTFVMCAAVVALYGLVAALLVVL